MKERPLLFSAPMVRALIAGTKSQTRRVVKAPGWDPASPEYGGLTGIKQHADERIGLQAYFWHARSALAHGVRCPYGQPGDRLWVRETWREWSDAAWHYAADGLVLPKQRDRELAEFLAQRAPFTWESYTWRPSIHMPRAASRITLEVTGVRVERLKDISADDAYDEGAADWAAETQRNGNKWPNIVRAYQGLWESINGPGSWDANPWVWVLSFRRLPS